MNKLLPIALLLALAGCTRTISRQELVDYTAKAGGGRDVSGIWVRDAILWYTGSAGKYDYYEFVRDPDLISSVERFRMLTASKGDEFPRTVDRSKWRQMEIALPPLGHTLYIPKAYLNEMRKHLATQPTVEIFLTTRPVDLTEAGR